MKRKIRIKTETETRTAIDTGTETDTVTKILSETKIVREIKTSTEIGIKTTKTGREEGIRIEIENIAKDQGSTVLVNSAVLIDSR